MILQILMRISSTFFLDFSLANMDFRSSPLVSYHLHSALYAIDIQYQVPLFAHEFHPLLAWYVTSKFRRCHPFQRSRDASQERYCSSAASGDLQPWRREMQIGWCFSKNFLSIMSKSENNSVCWSCRQDVCVAKVILSSLTSCTYWWENTPPHTWLMAPPHSWLMTPPILGWWPPS